jgi:hypothetical protein
MAVGVNVALRFRTLIVDNAGRSGAVTMLTDPGQTSYNFDVISLVNMGRLAWQPAQTTPFVIPATLTAAQLLGRGAGLVRLTVNDNTVLSLLSTPTISAFELHVSALGTVITPAAFTMDTGSVLNLAGTLSGTSSLYVSQGTVTVTGVIPADLAVTLDLFSTLRLQAGARSASLSSAFSFSSLVIKGASNLAVTTFSSFTVTGLLQVQDLSYVTIAGPLSLAVLAADTLDLAGSSSYLSFFGSLTIQTSTLYVRAGAYISGDGGGFGSSQSACVASTASFGAGAGGSNGGYGSTSQGAVAGTRMTPCGAIDSPVLMGSGGMAQGSAGTAGGGALAILANSSVSSTVVLNGTIRMSGTNITNTACAVMVGGCA